MDTVASILGSTSSSVNPLQAAIGHTNASLQKDMNTSVNEKKKPKA